MELLWFIIIGMIAGWLAGQIMKGRGFGFVGNLVVGIIGALLGGFVFRLLGVDAYGTFGMLVMATIGAVLFLAIAGFVKRA